MLKIYRSKKSRMERGIICDWNKNISVSWSRFLDRIFLNQLIWRKKNKILDLDCILLFVSNDYGIKSYWRSIFMYFKLIDYNDKSIGIIELFQFNW